MNDAPNPGLDKLDLDASMLDKLVADKMELHCRQQLSAMLDGALSPDEARFLLRRLQHDHELAACWERWQLCGDLMRGNAPAVLPSDFAQRVSAALTAESSAAGSQAASAHGPRWARWAGGAALAASVAATALFVAQRNPGIDAQAPGPVRQVSASSAPSPSLQGARPEPGPAPAPAAPSQPDLGGTAALAATAVAVAELPRRTVRRNRVPAVRNTPVETAPARTQADAMAVVAAVDLPPARGAVEDISALPAGRDPFVGEVIVPTARPWPRAVLPGTINGALNADYGMGGSADSGSGFEYFEPQVPVETPPQP